MNNLNELTTDIVGGYLKDIYSLMELCGLVIEVEGKHVLNPLTNKMEWTKTASLISWEEADKENPNRLSLTERNKLSMLDTNTCHLLIRNLLDEGILETK